MTKDEQNKGPLYEASLTEGEIKDLLEMENVTAISLHIEDERLLMVHTLLALMISGMAQAGGFDKNVFYNAALHGLKSAGKVDRDGLIKQAASVISTQLHDLRKFGLLEGLHYPQEIQTLDELRDKLKARWKEEEE